MPCVLVSAPKYNMILSMRIQYVLIYFLTLQIRSSSIQLPDHSGSAVIESNGEPGICNSPCFRLYQSYEVYLDGNPTNPIIGNNCGVGENTYIYKLSHLGGAGPSFPGITEFDLNLDDTSQVAEAGFLEYSQNNIDIDVVDPSSTTVDTNVVRWRFLTYPIMPGSTSSYLFVCSPLPPTSTETGNTTVTVHAQTPLLAESSLKVQGTSMGPLLYPTRTLLLSQPHDDEGIVNRQQRVDQIVMGQGRDIEPYSGHGTSIVRRRRLQRDQNRAGDSSDSRRRNRNRRLRRRR